MTGAISPALGDGNNTIPQWVIVGAPWPDGQCAVYASASLTEAELRMETDRAGRASAYEQRDWQRTADIGQRVVMTLVMKDFVVLVAATYAEALQALMGQWQPPDSGTDWPVGPRAIGGGR